MMKFFKQIDLTKGKPWKVIILFAIPIFLSLVLSNAFSLINSLVLKTTVGGNSVTAISSTGSISAILFQFAYGCSGGFATLTSADYGNKDFKSVRKTFYNGIYLSLVIGFIITILGLLVYKDLLIFLDVDAIYFDKAAQYYFIILISFVFLLMSNYLANTLRAMGDSTAPLLISFFSTAINVVMAFLLTGVIRFDTRGVAIATVLANVVNVVVTIIYIFKKYDYLDLRNGLEKFDSKICSTLLKLGIPLGLQWSILFVGSFFQSKTVNGFGPEATKAAGCFSSIEGYLIMPISAIASAFLSFVGQNYGNTNIKRIKEGIGQAMLINIVTWIFIIICGFLIIDYVPYIFLPIEEVNDPVSGPLIKYYCSTYLKVVIPLMVFQGILTVCRSTLQGIQKPLIPFISGIGELFTRLSICLLLPSIVNPLNPLSNESFISVCFSNPGAWFTSILIMGGSTLYFYFNKTNELVLGHFEE